MPLGKTEFVTVEGVRLEARQWPGRDLPILLLHEALGSLSMWRDFPERLAKATGHRVIAWSRRGFGGSDPLSGWHEPDYLHHEAAALPPLMNVLGIECAHLFGHSDGASIALIAASLHQDRIASLVLEAPHVFVEDVTIDGIRAMQKVYETSDLRRRLGRHHSDPDRVFRRWTRIWLDPRFRSWNIEGLLSTIRAPALLIQGEGDEYGTMEQLDRIAAAMPAAQRLELAECGHSPHRDQGPAVLAATAAFLSGVNS
jgi:pimeloyl-ACP methyl ester carboxylesterase